MTTEDLREKGKKLAREMSDLMNSSSGAGAEGFIEEMNKDHRTLQQSFTRFCLQWLENVAERQGPQNVDLRNKASQEVCENLMEGWKLYMSKKTNIGGVTFKMNWSDYKPSKWLPFI